MKDSNVLLVEVEDSIRKILEKKFKEPNKRRVYTYPDRFNFACPYCGDSTTSSLKKRGNLYLKDMGFHCFNCGKHTNYIKMLKDFGMQISPETAIGIQGIISDVKYNKKESKILDLSVISELRNNSLDRAVLKKVYRLSEISPTMDIYGYLKSRCLNGKTGRFLYNKYKNELYVLNNTKDEKVAGLQIRSFDKDKVKYRTYNMEKLHKDSGVPIESDNLDLLNTLSTVYNIDSIDFLKPIYVFEGGMDSFFIRNSIGISGVKRNVDVIDDLPNCRYFFDNDKTGFKRTIEKIKEGKSAFMWGRFLGDYNIVEHIKDFNELVVWISKNKRDFDFRVLANYFSNNILDICEL